MKMKYILSVSLTLMLLSCESKKENSTEITTPHTESAAVNVAKEKVETVAKLEPQVAVDFLNSYIKNCNSGDENNGIVEFIQSSPLATKQFKSNLKKLIADAFAEDPVMGLGFDPLFDAQDYPDAGVELLDFNSETGYLTVKGIKWKDFKVTMKVVEQNGKTMVDGCGVVNIPEDKRAER